MLVLDLINAIPETDDQQEKADLGTLELYMGSTRIAEIPFTEYKESAYEATGGILEFPLPSEVAPGPIKLVQRQPSGQQTVPAVLLEQAEFLAETDQWGVYLDQGQTSQVTLTVMQNGEPASSSVSLLPRAVRFAHEPAHCQPGGELSGCKWPAPRATDRAGKQGKATFGLKPILSGACMVGVFPFIGNAVQPTCRRLTSRSPTTSISACASCPSMTSWRARHRTAL